MDFNKERMFKIANSSELQLAGSLKTGADSDNEYHLRIISPEYAFHQGLWGILCRYQPCGFFLITSMLGLKGHSPLLSRLETWPVHPAIEKFILRYK